jgi:hypothetical protein
VKKAEFTQTFDALLRGQMSKDRIASLKQTGAGDRQCHATAEVDRRSGADDDELLGEFRDARESQRIWSATLASV